LAWRSAPNLFCTVQKIIPLLKRSSGFDSQQGHPPLLNSTPLALLLDTARDTGKGRRWFV